MVYKSDGENSQEDSMGETSDFQTNSLDELLVSLVRVRPALYDIRVPQKDRTKLMKQALWYEISKSMQGRLKPEAAETRWKYLRENFLKARKKHKIKEDLARRTGIPLSKKYSFRYHKIMEFLNESLDYQKLVALKSATKGKTRNNTGSRVQTPKVSINPLVQITPNVNSINIQSVPIVAAVSENFEEVDVDMHQDSPCSPYSQQTSEFESLTNVKSNISNYDQIFLECLQKPIEKPSPIDGFLIRLGEGLKRLPYRERSKLELEFLTRLHEVEEEFELYEEN